MKEARKEGDVGLLRCLLKIPWDALGLRLWGAPAAPAAVEKRHKIHLGTRFERVGYGYKTIRNCQIIMHLSAWNLNMIRWFT